MFRIFNSLIVSTCLISSAGAAVQENADPSGFVEAEQFVHGHLYDSMLQVWASDRRAWNKLLNVHACGGEQQQEKLASSYSAAESLFRQSIQNFADSQSQFGEENQKAVLNDVSQLAYRLFSASYAHGYARQVQQLTEFDDAIQQDLCGVSDKVTMPEMVEYSNNIHWRLSTTMAQQDPLFDTGLKAVEQHAQHGYRSFNKLLKQQYDNFDALVYSHAYQDPEAYDALFFSVNGYANVESYQAGVESLSGIEKKRSEEDAIPHADFAYLILASGYHWGKLSVLAMLEEEFPRLHAKTKSSATKHIQKVTQSIVESDAS